MPISNENFIAMIREAVPQFAVDAEWVKSNFTYLVVNDLARYICENASDCNTDEVKKSLHFLEACLEEGEPFLRDLIHEGLETLVSCKGIAEIKENFGPRVQLLWKEYFEDAI